MWALQLPLRATDMLYIIYIKITHHTMQTMSITIDEKLYSRLKRTAGQRGMSRFIAEAVREKLRSSEDELYKEYLAAQRDNERRQVLDDWNTLETEGWR